nr:MAG TPA: hypothetical protein [Caudoviricetes sp.]
MDYASDKHWGNAEIDRICRRQEIAKSLLSSKC